MATQQSTNERVVVVVVVVVAVAVAVAVGSGGNGSGSGKSSDLGEGNREANGEHNSKCDGGGGCSGGLEW